MDIARPCDPVASTDSVWHMCEVDGAAFTACGEQVGCDAWFTESCGDSHRAMFTCFGEPDPGAEPSRGWVNDGECDEPEGTNLCAEGTDTADCAGGGDDGPSCEPGTCSGCVTECDDFGCYQCCWACNGNSCEQSCNF